MRPVLRSGTARRTRDPATASSCSRVPYDSSGTLFIDVLFIGQTIPRSENFLKAFSDWRLKTFFHPALNEGGRKKFQLSCSRKTGGPVRLRRRNVSGGLARRQVAGEGLFVEQDFDKVDRAGQVGVGEHGVKVGFGLDAVMPDPEIGR